MKEQNQSKIHDEEFLKNRMYYSKIPKHVLLLPDGGRRYGYPKGLTDMEIYNIGQKKCQDFLEVCFNEFNIDTVSIFFLRPSSFDLQRRTEENLKAILIAINKLAKNLLNEKVKIKSKVYIDTITLAGNSWMEKPERIRESKELTKSWDELKDTLEKLKERNKNADKKIIFLINYSGKREIEEGLKENSLQIKEQVGLLIRVGDEMRLSDCPLYILSESHLVLIPKFLPEVSKEDFKDALNKFYDIST